MLSINRKPDLELEYRFKIDDKGKMSRILNKLAKIVVKREHQTNVMFDNTEKLMQISNGRVRIQTIKNRKKVLTYKKPITTKGHINKEIEYEIEFVDTNGQIEKILKAMEFTPATSYERFRTQWETDGVIITLDEYPFSDLIEIEGPREKIENITKKLGFNPKKGLLMPCDTLFQEWRKERGLPFKPHMRFNDFNK